MLIRTSITIDSWEGVISVRATDLAGAQIEVSLPSGPVVLALTPVVLVIFGVVVFSLVDLARAPSVKYLPKVVWGLIIVLGCEPLGAIVYLAVGRERRPRRGQPATESRQRQQKPEGSRVIIPTSGLGLRRFGFPDLRPCPAAARRSEIPPKGSQSCRPWRLPRLWSRWPFRRRSDGAARKRCPSRRVSGAFRRRWPPVMNA